MKKKFIAWGWVLAALIGAYIIKKKIIDPKYSNKITNYLT